MSDANLRFPKDEASVGGFTTRLKFESWTNSNVNKDKSESAGEVIKPDHVFDIWLPMPNELSTGYTGSFEENDNMSISESRSGGMAGVAKGRAAGLAKGGSLEIAGLLNTVLAPNASAKMSSRSILNNNMGVSFNGINLREHTFSWNLMPKSADDQKDILEIIKEIKLASTPGNEKLTTKEKKAVVNKNTAESKDEESTMDWITGLAVDSMAHVTTLTIPNTVSVSFYKGVNYDINTHLFKVGASFITSFGVSYINGNGWEGREDGSPTQTVITMTLKEIKAVTQTEIHEGA